MTQLSPAIIAAAVALMVAFITPAVTNLRARRQAVTDKFDTAVSALLILHAYRNTPTGLSMSVESRT